MTKPLQYELPLGSEYENPVLQEMRAEERERLATFEPASRRQRKIRGFESLEEALGDEDMRKILHTVTTRIQSEDGRQA